MSDVIRLLPDSIANQIAAGEVIQRPASVVKELLENALDAGADNIRLDVREAGRELIRVTDNGKGMSQSDARMAFERHATSKISSFQDLFSLRTMGFRGEALASIAAVAQVELQTRRAEDELGTKLAINGSKVEDVSTVTSPQGTILSVMNLFFNVPARRKFLKTNETEFRHILSEYERIALVNPNVAFSVYHSDQLVQDLPIASLKKRILDLFGKRIEKDLIPIGMKSPITNISGFIGRPDGARKRGSLQYLFVNGRYMRHPYFHKAIMSAYEAIIPQGSMPNYFLYFEVDPAQIDVNIHPTKTEIKFTDEQAIFKLIGVVVREALSSNNAVPSIDFDRKELIDIPVYRGAGKEIARPAVDLNPAYNPFKETGLADPIRHSRREAPDLGWGELFKQFENKHGQTSTPTTPASSTSELFDTGTVSEQSTPLEPSTSGSSESLCYIYRGRYLVTSLSRGLALIDYHRAHKRILYDRFLANESARHIEQQQLLFPEALEFSPGDAPAIESAIRELQTVGFELSPLGVASYSLSAAPVAIIDHAADIVKDVIYTTLESGKSSHEQMLELIAAKVAEHQAIPRGRFLTNEEANDLLAELFASEESTYTPDGKIIVSIIDEADITRRFE